MREDRVKNERSEWFQDNRKYNLILWKHSLWVSSSQCESKSRVNRSQGNFSSFLFFSNSYFILTRSNFFPTKKKKITKTCHLKSFSRSFSSREIFSLLSDPVFLVLRGWIQSQNFLDCDFQEIEKKLKVRRKEIQKENRKKTRKASQKVRKRKLRKKWNQAWREMFWFWSERNFFPSLSSSDFVALNVC